jgi:RIO-like serine/threonine protein kinase
MFTADRFLDPRRAASEAEVLNYLSNYGFPVVKPFCTVAIRRRLTWQLHLITVFEEDAIDVVQRMSAATGKHRLRIVKRLACAFWELQQAGVYHPDLHLRNVLVNSEGRLIFLDFDRAYRKNVRAGDLECTLRRLNRFVNKMERMGRFSATRLEKALFLRTYARLSGVDMTPRLAGAKLTTVLRERLGWGIESIVYGER